MWFGVVLPVTEDVGVIRPEIDDVGVMRPEIWEVGVMRPDMDTGVVLPEVVLVRRLRGVVAYGLFKSAALLERPILRPYKS